MSELQAGKLKIAISVEKRHRFKENYSSSSSHQAGKKKKGRLPAAPRCMPLPRHERMAFSGFIKARQRPQGKGGSKQRDEERKPEDEQKQEQGIDTKWTHISRERSIGQPTHEHQLRLQLHHPPWTDRNEKEEDRREGEEEDEDRKKNRGTNQTKTEEIEQRKT